MHAMSRNALGSGRRILRRRRRIVLSGGILLIVLLRRIRIRVIVCRRRIVVIRGTILPSAYKHCGRRGKDLQHSPWFRLQRP